MREFTVVITPDEEDGGYVVTVPALPGCHTQGDTMEEAIANAREAIEGYLLSLKDLERPIPEEHEHTQAIVIKVAA
jgi:antitoxin HicB